MTKTKQTKDLRQVETPLDMRSKESAEAFAKRHSDKKHDVSAFRIPVKALKRMDSGTPVLDGKKYYKKPLCQQGRDTGASSGASPQ